MGFLLSRLLVRSIIKILIPNSEVHATSLQGSGRGDGMGCGVCVCVKWGCWYGGREGYCCCIIGGWSHVSVGSVKSSDYKHSNSGISKHICIQEN